MKVSGHSQAPAVLPTVETTLVPIECDAVRIAELVWMFGRSGKFLAPPQIRNPDRMCHGVVVIRRPHYCYRL
jgi:hypothetical protein